MFRRKPAEPEPIDDPKENCKNAGGTGEGWEVTTEYFKEFSMTNPWRWQLWENGFRHVGETKGGLMAFQMLPEEMPDPLPIPELQGSFAL